jgi:hypothetical protein
MGSSHKNAYVPKTAFFGGGIPRPHTRPDKRIPPRSAPEFDLSRIAGKFRG